MMHGGMGDCYGVDWRFFCGIYLGVIIIRLKGCVILSIYIGIYYSISDRVQVHDYCLSVWSGISQSEHELQL